MAVQLGAVGKVTTGFSKPYIAKYNNANGVISFTDTRILARGVEVSIEPETSDLNRFYADNLEAETAGGYMTGGTLTLTVDGLLRDAEQMISGLPEVGEDGWLAFGDDQKTPYLAVGFLTRYMSGGVTCYTPTIILKTVFNQISKTAHTQEEDIDWQTQELTASIVRSDNANHDWKWLGDDFATEEEAEAVLQTKLGYVAPAVDNTDDTTTDDSEGA